MPAPKRPVDREARLRAGYVEEQHFGGTPFYFYWEPHYDGKNERFVQDFCIEWGVLRKKEYIHDFKEAEKRFEEIERQAIIDAAVHALLGPQDTVKIMRPPTFK